MVLAWVRRDLSCLSLRMMREDGIFRWAGLRDFVQTLVSVPPPFSLRLAPASWRFFAPVASPWYWMCGWCGLRSCSARGRLVRYVTLLLLLLSLMELETFPVKVSWWALIDLLELPCYLRVLFSLEMSPRAPASPNPLQPPAPPYPSIPPDPDPPPSSLASQFQTHISLNRPSPPRKSPWLERTPPLSHPPSLASHKELSSTSSHFGEISNFIYMSTSCSAPLLPSKPCIFHGCAPPWAWPNMTFMVLIQFVGSPLLRLYTVDLSPLRFSHRHQLLTTLTFAIHQTIRFSYRKKLPPPHISDFPPSFRLSYRTQRIPPSVSHLTRRSFDEEHLWAGFNRICGFLNLHLSLISGTSLRPYSTIGCIGSYVRIVTVTLHLGMVILAILATSLSLRGVLILRSLSGNCKKSFTELFSCVAGYTGPEEANRFVSTNFGGKDSDSKLHGYVTRSKHFGYAVKIILTHSSLVSNSLSSDQILSVLSL